MQKNNELEKERATLEKFLLTRCQRLSVLNSALSNLKLAIFDLKGLLSFKIDSTLI
jgi:hypothetical protein